MLQVSLEDNRIRGAQNVRRAQKTPSQVCVFIKHELDTVIDRYVRMKKQGKWSNSKKKHLSEKTALRPLPSQTATSLIVVIAGFSTPIVIMTIIGAVSLLIFKVLFLFATLVMLSKYCNLQMILNVFLKN